MKTLLVQMADRQWTEEALHVACAMAHSSNDNAGTVILLRMIETQHVSWLGTDFGTASSSPEESNLLWAYKAIAEKYGVDLCVEPMQWVDYVDALVQAADALEANAVFAHVPAPSSRYGAATRTGIYAASFSTVAWRFTRSTSLRSRSPRPQNRNNSPASTKSSNDVPVGAFHETPELSYEMVEADRTSASFPFSTILAVHLFFAVSIASASSGLSGKYRSLNPALGRFRTPPSAAGRLDHEAVARECLPRTISRPMRFPRRHVSVIRAPFTHVAALQAVRRDNPPLAVDRYPCRSEKLVLP